MVVGVRERDIGGEQSDETGKTGADGGLNTVGVLKDDDWEKVRGCHRARGAGGEGEVYVAEAEESDCGKAIGVDGGQRPAAGLGVDAGGDVGVGHAGRGARVGRLRVARGLADLSCRHCIGVCSSYDAAESVAPAPSLWRRPALETALGALPHSATWPRRLVTVSLRNSPSLRQRGVRLWIAFIVHASFSIQERPFGPS